MALVNVWSNALDVPELTCGDARLRQSSRGNHVIYADIVRGQAGWHIGLTFSSLPMLSNQLRTLLLPRFVTNPLSYDDSTPVRRIRAGELAKLAINAHGEPGRLFVAGRRNRGQALSLDTLERYERPLRTISTLIRQGSIIYLMGCNVAANTGSELLNELSGNVWRGAFVVGFTGVGFAHSGGMSRGSTCTEPGMRDTGHGSMSSGQLSDGTHPRWNDLRRLPWASHRSPSAVVSAYGGVVHSPGDPHVEAIPA